MIAPLGVLTRGFVATQAPPGWKMNAESHQTGVSCDLPQLGVEIKGARCSKKGGGGTVLLVVNTVAISFYLLAPAPEGETCRKITGHVYIMHPELQGHAHPPFPVSLLEPRFDRVHKPALQTTGTPTIHSGA